MCSSIIVFVIDSVRLKIVLVSMVYLSYRFSVVLSVVVIVICVMVLGSVIWCIVSRFFGEKCKLILNISRIMLILVSLLVSLVLVMMLGVNGLMIIFVSR